MDNEVLQQLTARTSLRAFSPAPVPAEAKSAILTAACMAPTAGNQQLYTILDITDQALKERLSETCDHQSFIAQAPLVLIFLADFQKWYDIFIEAGCAPRAPGYGELFLAIDDALIAAQNAVTAAESLGLGSCYIGDVMENYETHRDLLHLPRYVFPAAMVVFGYPKEGLTRAKPARAPMAHIVHENAYRHMDGEELREMLSQRSAPRGFEGWVEAFYNRKYNSDFAREMSRSVSAFLDQYGKQGGGRERE